LIVPRVWIHLILTSGRYFSIDYIRIKDIEKGALRGVTLNVEEGWNNDKMWLVAHNEPVSHQQGNLGFEVGRYTIHSTLLELNIDE
jgi:hypothetical protein